MYLPFGPNATYSACRTAPRFQTRLLLPFSSGAQMSAGLFGSPKASISLTVELIASSLVAIGPKGLPSQSTHHAPSIETTR